MVVRVRESWPGSYNEGATVRELQCAGCSVVAEWELWSESQGEIMAIEIMLRRVAAWS